MIRARLINRLPAERVNKVGVSANDLKSLVLTDGLKSDIFAALDSKDLADIKIGFFFAEQLLKPGGDKRFDEDLLQTSLRLFEIGTRDVQSHCVTMFALLGQRMGNYRELMLRALKGDDAQARRKALLTCRTFLNPDEIGPLEVFENDDYATEVGMGSHLIYELRNLALETIEKMIGRQFKKFEKTEIYKGKNVVFWWDWEPFHKWKNSIWHKLKLI
jgi:hypothetical protein